MGLKEGKPSPPPAAEFASSAMSPPSGRHVLPRVTAMQREEPLAASPRSDGLEQLQSFGCARPCGHHRRLTLPAPAVAAEAQTLQPTSNFVTAIRTTAHFRLDRSLPTQTEHPVSAIVFVEAVARLALFREDQSVDDNSGQTLQNLRRQYGQQHRLNHLRHGVPSLGFVASSKRGVIASDNPYCRTGM